MTDFNDRQRAFEAQFARDGELQFRVAARRDRLVGHWAAERMGLSGAEADAYAAAIVREDLKEAGDEDVIRKLVADLAQHGVGDAAIRSALGAAEADARRQVMETL